MQRKPPSPGLFAVGLRVARRVSVALALSLVATAGVVLAAYGGDLSSAAQARAASPLVMNAPPTTITVADPLECLHDGRVTLSASPAEVVLGAGTTLRWSASFPADCLAARSGKLSLAGQPVGPSGTLSVRPKVPMTYRLAISVAGRGDVSLAAAKVTVRVPEKATVDIEGSTDGWKRLLIDALSAKGATVRLADEVDMDLTGYDPVYVTEGVSLTGGRSAQKLGPRLYTTGRPRPLLLIRCAELTIRGNNARITGFRLHGPRSRDDVEEIENDGNLERGIDVDSCRGIEIANMEIAGWSGEGVHVTDPIDKIEAPEDVRIHDNFIHHNQHDGTSGYGVDVTDAARALIERNVFDGNRHAIALGHTNDRTGYVAHRNLVLRGGGVHGCFANVCTHTHQFDVHGDRNCGVSDWSCGNAGDVLRFTDNAFQYHEGNAIKLRGTPRVDALIRNNVFVQKKLEDSGANLGGEAVELKSRVRVTLGKNTIGVDTFGRYGVCDFDGDRKDDLFLPTGVTWWYSSAGKREWRYLNAASERLDQLALGYFDGDQRCDVFAVNGNQWEISSGGTAPWRSLGTYGVPLDQLRFGSFGSIRDHRTDRGNRPSYAFRRAPDGTWSVVVPGRHDWRALGSSSRPLSELRLGDFVGDAGGGVSGGDGITDVLAVVGGRWSVSRSGTGSWETLNTRLGSGLEPVLIADANGNGTDDVVSFKRSGFAPNWRGTWQVSWDGRSAWETLQALPVTSTPGTNLPVWPFLFAGRFDESPGADLLSTDPFVRAGMLYGKATGKLVRHSLHRY